MIITAVKPNFINYPKTPAIKKSTSLSFGAGKSVSIARENVAIQNKAEVMSAKSGEEKFFEKFLQKKGKVTKEEYEDIIKNHPAVLLMCYKYCEKFYEGSTTPQETALNTLRADKYFRDNFQNYRIISLGTSPSPITEQLANMGHEVIFLPVSGIRNSYRMEKHTLKNTPQLKALMEYLATKGIDDGKLNLVFDFAVSGKTLNITTKFIKEYFGLSHEEISKVSLGEQILNNYNDRASRNLKTDIVNSKIEHASNVAHFPVLPESEWLYLDQAEDTVFYSEDISKRELFEQFDNYSAPLARAFALCTMRETEKIKNCAI